jgi:hypothetical protein
LTTFILGLRKMTNSQDQFPAKQQRFLLNARLKFTVNLLVVQQASLLVHYDIKSEKSPKHLSQHLFQFYVCCM